MTPIREPEVALHVAGKLSRTRSYQVVEASRTDEQVRDWLEKYTRLLLKQQLQEQNRTSAAPVDLGREEDRELARRMYRSAEEDEPLAEPSDQRKASHRVEHDIVWSLAGDTTPPAPPKLMPRPEVDSQTEDKDAKVIRFVYSAAKNPFGMARVTVVVGGKETFRRLVAFPKYSRDGRDVRMATLSMAALGIPLVESSKPIIDVEFAAESNLDEFPLAEVEQLLNDGCADAGSYLAVKELVDHLKKKGQK